MLLVSCPAVRAAVASRLSYTRKYITGRLRDQHEQGTPLAGGPSLLATPTTRAVRRSVGHLMTLSEPPPDPAPLPEEVKVSPLAALAATAPESAAPTVAGATCSAAR